MINLQIRMERQLQGAGINYGIILSVWGFCEFFIITDNITDPVQTAQIKIARSGKYYILYDHFIKVIDIDCINGRVVPLQEYDLEDDTIPIPDEIWAIVWTLKLTMPT